MKDASQLCRLVIAALAVASLVTSRAEASLRFVSNWPSAVFDRIYVSDEGDGSVKVLDRNFVLVSTIRYAIVAPQGDWIDRHGDLYVANAPGYSSAAECSSPGNVVEFAPLMARPVFAYTAGLMCPVQVTTDNGGNVYVFDAGPNPGELGSYSFFVNEYRARRNVVVAKYSAGCDVLGLFGARPGGLAVVNGSLMSACTNGATGIGSVVHIGGLATCGAVVGMIADGAGNLILPSPGAGAGPCGVSPSVRIIARGFTGMFPPPLPYDGLSYPTGAALSQDERLLFVADPGNSDVAVLSYPAGTLMTTLGAASGLTEPICVAVAPPQ
jgi:hypothetical protein